MFRNQYDHDVSIWSPQGRIHQIEYAMEAVKQGTASIALKNKDYAIIVALKRAPSELSSYQEKIIHIDDHIGLAIAGLTADGHLLSRSMRRECVDNRWAYEQPIPVCRLLSSISLKMQVPTQRYGRRPFGVGMLVIGYDSAGPHVYYLCPSSNAYNCKCFAIGSRSQSARTYLERNMDQLPDTSLEELVCHGFRALQKTLPNELTLTTKNCSLAIVGKDINFTSYEDDDIYPYLKKFEDLDAPVSGSSEMVETPMEQDQPAYVTSTQYTNWHFSPPELVTLRTDCNVEALKRFVSSSDQCESDQIPQLHMEQELNIVKRYVFLMRVLFDKFKNPQLPDEIYGYAATYFKRFYLKNSVMNFYPRDMMLTCLYVACKAADFPIGIQVFVSHIPRNQDRYSHFILNSELFLLESLGYDLWVFTPYRALLGFIVELIAYQKRLELRFQSENDLKTDLRDIDCNYAHLAEEMRLEGFNFITLWYQVDLCLTVHPSQIALAVLVELGRTRPQFDVEVFVRDELCGCDPMDKLTNLKSSLSDKEDSDEESDVLNVTLSGTSSQSTITPEARWRDLSSRLDYIRQTVDEFLFITSLEPLSEEECILDQCRNPLYDLDSQEYAEAKSKADSLMEMFE